MRHKGFSLIELLIVVAIILVIAALAVPSLVKARISANESGTIGDTRTVISAQAAYASANAGLVEGAMTCLNDPDTCIPAYPATAPTCLDSNIANLLFKSGAQMEALSGRILDRTRSRLDIPATGPSSA